MNVLNFYVILEVARDATPEQIKTAFRRLAKKWHPDRFPDQETKAQATRQMQLINQANDTLKDADKRRQYDAYLRNPRIPASPSRSKPAAPYRPAAPRENPWRAASPRAQTPPRPTPPPSPKAAPNPAQERASAERHERFNAEVKSYFDDLIRKNPTQKQRLLSTLRWQITKKKATVRKGLEAGHSEEASLRRWALAAKRAGDNGVKAAPMPPSEAAPSRPRPVPTPKQDATPLDETVVASVKWYYDELIARHPLDRQALNAALHWQMTRKKVEVANLIRAGQSEENALWRWAYEARRAADGRVRKR
jgi:curved DNA-binding protein CbpA